MTTYKVTMNCSNLAQGYSLIDSSTNTVIADPSSFELVLSEISAGLNIWGASIAVSNGVMTVPVIFVFDDAMEALGFLALASI